MFSPAGLQLHQTKSLIVSLMVAMLATDLVSRILGQGLELKAGVGEVVTLAVLVAYISILEHHPSSIANKIAPSEQKSTDQIT